VIDVPGLRQTPDRMNQQGAADSFGRPLRQLLVSAMDGVSHLEGDDIRISHRPEQASHLSRSLSKLDEVVMLRQI
jgi:hypothetical protein